MEQRFINRCFFGLAQLPKTAMSGSIPATSEHPLLCLSRRPSTAGARAKLLGNILAHHGDIQDNQGWSDRLSPVPGSTMGSAHLLPPLCARRAPALRRLWPPASQPFPGNLIAAADELKMHFLPPCCKIFINVRREHSSGSRRPGPQRGEEQWGPWHSGWGWGPQVWQQCPGDAAGRWRHGAVSPTRSMGKLRHRQGKCLTW